jgi:hypothetical protein
MRNLAAALGAQAPNPPRAQQLRAGYGSPSPPPHTVTETSELFKYHDNGEPLIPRLALAMHL